ncbi:peptidase S8/S53 domain-containing protein [Cantharellus anzutake]|uniref:peptidase S8/S53 domain-containing protein n=1 Tax=Cantharellus anzutake TaxID=1750568 RepID=UPI001903EC49|nr:peptidase S8/S53 domain-containing protein [Cantharellus anzutake]KAF8325645.1 peptidase S8/S53 domain-containing protein [Cantharellus anzutake]
MKFSTVTILVVIFASTTATALAASVRIRMPKGPVRPDSYIVVLKSGTNMEDHIEGITRISTRSPGSEFLLTHRYEIPNGYSAHLTGASLAHILSCPEVAYVVADGITFTGHDLREVNERDVTERNDVAAKIGDNPVKRCGSGVDIYIPGAGVYRGHSCFGTDQVILGKIFGPYEDGYSGRDTYVAALAAGLGYGPATGAKVISLKVCDNYGMGYASNLVAALSWAYQRKFRYGHPSIILLPPNMVGDNYLDQVIQSLIDHGLHIVIGAGDRGVNAESLSPQHLAGVNTIGAIDNLCNFATFSNWGPAITASYLGVRVKSAWSDSNTDSMELSSTDGAAAGVAGLIATRLGQHDEEPAALTSDMIDHALPLVVKAPRDTPILRVVGW